MDNVDKFIKKLSKSNSKDKHQAAEARFGLRSAVTKLIRGLSALASYVFNTSKESKSEDSKDLSNKFDKNTILKGIIYLADKISRVGNRIVASISSNIALNVKKESKTMQNDSQRSHPTLNGVATTPIARPASLF